MRTLPRLLLPVLILVAGCGPDLSSHEGIVVAQLDLMDEMVDILEGITDEASAKAVLSKIEALKERLEEIQKAGKEIGKPAKDEENRLEEKYKSRQVELQKRLRAAISKIPPAARKALGESMRGFR